MTVSTVNGVDALLEGIVDYAGLFPPAGFGMPEAVERYRRHRSSKHGWMLGNYVLPAGRLDEFGAVSLRPEFSDEKPWSLSLLLPAEPTAALRKAERFLTRWSGHLRLASIELPPTTKAAINGVVTQVPEGVRVYAEVATGPEAESVLEEVREAGACAKIRTGGVVEEAIPPVEEVADFLVTCHRLELPFKATAGLHHPFRSRQPLSGRSGSARAVMHGFLNVSMSALLLRHGLVEAGELQDVLTASPSELELTEDRLAWRDRRASSEMALETRRHFFHSFGSCSFSEPIQDLQEHGLL